MSYINQQKVHHAEMIESVTAWWKESTACECWTGWLIGTEIHSSVNEPIHKELKGNSTPRNRVSDSLINRICNGRCYAHACLHQIGIYVKYENQEQFPFFSYLNVSKINGYLYLLNI